ncbi:hypothetical protein BX616_000376, partial [Lobosporangium transversale]
FQTDENWLCLDRLPDPSKSSSLLYKYVQVHDDKCESLFSNCMDSRLPLKDLKNAAREALSCIESVLPAAAEMFSILIQRITLILINSEILTELVKNIGESEEHGQASGELLRSISLIFPAIFKDHLVEIMALLHQRDFTGASDLLQTLAEFAKQFPKSIPTDVKAKETLHSFIGSGTVEQARDAAIVLASLNNSDSECKDIAETINERLSVQSAGLLRDLAVLSQLTLYSPQALERINSSVTSFVVRKLLMTNTSEQETTFEVGRDWVEKEELDEYSLSKIMGLKVLVNRTIALAESDPTAAQEVVRPVFKLLWTILNQEGEIVEEKNTNDVLKSHLRLNAARSVLKLTRGRPLYEKMVTAPDFMRLSLIVQDPVYRVRQGLATRIMKYLRTKELHIRYLSFLFLAAHEPELEWRLHVRGFLVQQSRIQDTENKLMLNELTIARLLHLLANHPDFMLKTAADDSNSLVSDEVHTVEDLNLSVKYIEFYLETMANSENISLIYHIAALLKTVRFTNANEPTKVCRVDQQNLYVLSDLAQYVIQEKSRAHNWTLSSYPGKVNLPRELFVPLGSDELTHEVSSKYYLPLEWVHAREHKSERKSKGVTDIEKKMGQASKRRSRSPSASMEMDGIEDTDGAKPGASANTRVKRTKKSKIERVKEEPSRRMASRAAKSKTTTYRDVGSGDEEDEGDED